MNVLITLGSIYYIMVCWERHNRSPNQTFEAEIVGELRAAAARHLQDLLQAIRI